MAGCAPDTSPRSRRTPDTKSYRSVDVPSGDAVHSHEERRTGALRLSNAIAIAMLLFVAGYAYGRFVGRRPWVLRIALVRLGCLLVRLTKALGG